MEAARTGRGEAFPDLGPFEICDLDQHGSLLRVPRSSSSVQITNNALLNEMLGTEHLHTLYTVGAEYRAAVLIVRINPKPQIPHLSLLRTELEKMG